MLDFPSKTIQYIKNILVKQQKEVEKNLKGVIEEDPAMNKVIAESSEPGADAYIADVHTKDVIIEQQLKTVNTSIKVALLKISKGTYGKCEKCGKGIEIGRLLAMPTAQYCLSDSKKTSK